jgi:nitroreductase
MDLATVDKLLTTTRTVRKRLDCTRPVDPEIIQTCLEIAIQASTGGNIPGITSWWSPMQPNTLILLPSTNGHLWRCIHYSGKRRLANRTPA